MREGVPHRPARSCRAFCPYACASALALRFSPPDITAFRLRAPRRWSVSTAEYRHCQAMESYIVSASQVLASALWRGQGVGSLAHRAGAAIACERSVTSTSAAMPGVPPLPSGLPRFALPATGRPTRHRHFAPDRRPARLASDNGWVQPLSRTRRKGRAATRPVGSAVKPSAPNNGRSTTSASEPGITAFGNHAGQWNRRGTPLPHTSEEQHSQCFAVVNRCAVAQTLVSARLRIVLG